MGRPPRLLRAGARALTREALVLTGFALLTALFYRHILFSGEVMSDPRLFRLVYPYREFLAEALRAGRIPLWNPYLFTGVPFLADPLSAALYPPHELLSRLDAPRAVAVSVASHTLVAAVTAYLFARAALGLVRPAAFTAGLVFAFGGFLGANAVDPAVVEAAAWLPLAMLGCDIACRRNLPAGVAVGGVALGMQALTGHAQVTALTLIGIAIVALVRALSAEQPGARPTRSQARSLPVRVGVWAGHTTLRCAIAILALGGIVALGLALAAPQLAPAWELLQLSPRADGASLERAAAGALAPGELVRALLPGFSEDPERTRLAHLGVVALGLAAVGILRGGTAGRMAVLLVLTGLALAVGQATPLLGWLHALSRRQFPFDTPAQALLLAQLGGALAAGAGLDALWPRADAGHGARPRWWPRPRHREDWGRLVWLVTVALVATWLYLLIARDVRGVRLPTTDVRQIWLGLGIVALDVALILPFVRPRRWLAAPLVAIVTAELLVAGARLPFTETVPAAAWAVEPALAPLLRDPTTPPRLGRPADLALDDPLPPPGLERYLLARQGRERLAPNAGMQDRVNTLEGLVTELNPPRALRHALETLTVTAPLADPAGAARFPASGEPRSLGVLPVATAGEIGPRLAVNLVFGAPVAPVQAGLVRFRPGLDLTIPPGASVEIAVAGSAEATGIALLSDLSAPVGEGAPVAELVVTEVGGGQRRRTLLDEVDTATRTPAAAETGDAPAGTPTAERGGAVGVDVPGHGVAFVSEQPLGRPARYRSVGLRNLTETATLHIHALSLVDDRTDGSMPVILAERLRRVAATEPPVYEDSRALPRASFASLWEVETDAARAVARLPALPLTHIVLDREPFAEAEVTSAADAAPDAPPAVAAATRIVEYLPERVVVDVRAPVRGVVVLRDTWYPGWTVYVDGRAAPVLRADGIFRAVAVEPGVHRVWFEFAPRSLERGEALASAGRRALLVLALATVIWEAARWSRRWWDPAVGSIGRV